MITEREALNMAISFIRKLVDVNGGYQYINGTQLVVDSYNILSVLGEVMMTPDEIAEKDLNTLMQNIAECKTKEDALLAAKNFRSCNGFTYDMTSAVGRLIHAHEGGTRLVAQCIGCKPMLKEALAQPEQEPVARVVNNGTPEGSTEWIPFTNRIEPLNAGDLLYTAPPQRKPLTDEDIKKAVLDNPSRN